MHTINCIRICMYTYIYIYIYIIHTHARATGQAGFLQNSSTNQFFNKPIRFSKFSKKIMGRFRKDQSGSNFKKKIPSAAAENKLSGWYIPPILLPTPQDCFFQLVPSSNNKHRIFLAARLFWIAECCAWLNLVFIKMLVLFLAWPSSVDAAIHGIPYSNVSMRICSFSTWSSVLMYWWCTAAVDVLMVGLFSKVAQCQTWHLAEITATKFLWVLQ